MYIKTIIITRAFFFAGKIDCAQSACDILSIKQKEISCDALTDVAILRFFGNGSVALQPFAGGNHIFLRDPLDQKPGIIYHPSLMTIVEEDKNPRNYNVLFIEEADKEREILCFSPDDIEFEPLTPDNQANAILSVLTFNKNSKHIATLDPKFLFNITDLSPECLKKLWEVKYSSTRSAGCILRMGGQRFWFNSSYEIKIDEDLVRPEISNIQRPALQALTYSSSSVAFILKQFNVGALSNKTERFATLICNSEGTFSLQPQGKEAFLVGNLHLSSIPSKPCYITVRDIQENEFSYNIVSIIQMNSEAVQSLAFDSEDVEMEKPLSQKPDMSPVYSIQGNGLYCTLRMRNDNIHKNGIYWNNGKNFLAISNLSLEILQAFDNAKSDNRSAGLRLHVGGLCFAPNKIDIDENFLKDAQEKAKKREEEVVSQPKLDSESHKSTNSSYINRYTISGALGIIAVLLYYFKSDIKFFLMKR